MVLHEERQTSEIKSVDELIEWLQSNTARVDLASSLAAGVGLSLIGVAVLSASILPLESMAVVRLILIATISYLIAGLIIHWLWIKPLRRVLPSWLMIACLGSLLIVVSFGALSFYGKTVASSAPTSLLQTLPAFIGDRMKDGLAVFAVLSLLTLPITATVSYAGGIVRAVRRWNKGEEPLSIQSTQFIRKKSSPLPRQK